MLYLEVVLKSVLSLSILFVLSKWIGSRQMSEMSMFDYINGITIGSIAAEASITVDDDVLVPLCAMLIYGGATVLLSWLSDKSLPARRFIVGRPYVIYQNGEFIYKHLKKCKIDLSEFLMAAREAGYFDLSELEAVVYEHNGKFSFLPVSDSKPLTPKDMNIELEKNYVFANIIMEGKIMPENLRYAGRDENWLNTQLEGQNIKDIKEVFLGVCNPGGDCYFFRKNTTKIGEDILL